MEGFVAKIVGAQFSYTGGWLAWMLLIAIIGVAMGLYLAISALLMGYATSGSLRASPKEEPLKFAGIMIVFPALLFFAPGALMILAPIHIGPRFNDLYKAAQKSPEKS